MMKKRFIGWNNIKKLIQEWLATFSQGPSRFSSKRIERALLFLGAYICSMYWFWTHVKKMNVGECIAFISVLFGYAGYTMLQTEKEKSFKKDNDKID